MTPKSSTLEQIIGYDPGFGNTKVCLAGTTRMVQSAVSIPRQIGLAAIGMRSAGSKARIVRINGHAYAVGLEAGARGALKTTMDYSAFTSLERRAMWYAALGEAMTAVNKTSLDSALLVIGLPVPLLEDQTQAKAVMENLKQLKSEHVFSVGDQTFRVSVDRLKVLAQPAGAYIDYAYDDQLVVRPGVSKTEVLILDIGMNTLDLYVLKNGQVLDSYVGGAEVGVRRLLELVATNGHDLMEMDSDLRAGSLKLEPAQLDGYLGEVLAAVKQIAPNLKRFNTVIPCGGGGVVLGERLRLALAAKGAALYWPEDLIATNVRGFWKYGRLKSA